MYWVFLISLSWTVVAVHGGRYAVAAGLYVLTGTCWLANSMFRPSRDRPSAISTARLPVVLVAIWPVAAAIAVYWFWERHHRQHRYLVHYPLAGGSTSLRYDHPEWLRSTDPAAARTAPSALSSLDSEPGRFGKWQDALAFAKKKAAELMDDQSVSIMDTARFGRYSFGLGDWTYVMFWVNRRGQVRRFM